MREQKIVEEKKVPALFDDADRRIMQALADGLSEVTVSEALRKRTLAAAQKQKEARRKKATGYRVFFGMLAAVAVLAIAVGIWGSARGGRKMEGERNGAASSENTMNHVEMMEGSAGGEFLNRDDTGQGNFWDDPKGTFGNVGDGEADGDNLGGYFPAEQEPQEISDTEWLYRELLALFDENGSDGEDVAGKGEETKDVSVAEDGEVRHISWQEDGKEISCEALQEGHYIVVTLREGNQTRSLELNEWLYGDILWELAENGK